MPDAPVKNTAVPNPAAEEIIEQLEVKLLFKKSELRDLATMGAVITSILDIDSILSVVMDMAVRLVKGEVGIILMEENDKLVARSSWGISEEFIHSLEYKNSKDLPTYVFEKREIVILNDLNLKNENGLVVESIICLPIKTSKDCYGVMTIINKEDGETFDDDDREILGMLLNFVAVAINNSMLVKDKLKKQQIEQEMAIAREVQNTILPSDINETGDVEIGVEYFPVGEVGGDFYDIIRVNDSEFVAVLGDVSNHGIPAALVMSAAAGIIKSILTDRPQIEMRNLAEDLNNILSSGIIKDHEMFVTLFFARFDLKNRILTYSNAGHLPGLFWNAQNKSVEKLTEGGPLVGQFGGTKYIQGEKRLTKECRLFLYTDGLTEASDKSRNLFGNKRTVKLFTDEIGLPPKEFCSKVKSIIDKYTTNAPADSIDDFTVLQIQV